MAHFAQLNDSNVVLRVSVLDNSDADTEANGIAKLKSIHGADTIWKQTSYNTLRNVHRLGGTPFRKNYAAIGYTYNSAIDGFVPPQPRDSDGNLYVSWQLNTTTGNWDPPVALPNTNITNGGSASHQWDETNRRRNEVE